MRRILVAIVVAVVCCATAPAATAELRTGGDTSPFTDDQGSATRPVFKSVHIRYDDAAGTAALHVRFFKPLASPDETSALRPWTVTVELGDYYGSTFGPVCGQGRDGLYAHAALGDDAPAVVSFDLLEARSFSAGKTFDDDRAGLTIYVDRPEALSRNYICGYVSVDKRDDWKARFREFVLPVRRVQRARRQRRVPGRERSVRSGDVVQQQLPDAQGHQYAGTWLYVRSQVPRHPAMPRVASASQAPEPPPPDGKRSDALHDAQRSGSGPHRCLGTAHGGHAEMAQMS